MKARITKTVDVDAPEVHQDLSDDMSIVLEEAVDYACEREFAECYYKGSIKVTSKVTPLSITANVPSYSHMIKHGQTVIDRKSDRSIDEATKKWRSLPWKDSTFNAFKDNPYIRRLVRYTDSTRDKMLILYVQLEDTTS